MGHAWHRGVVGGRLPALNPDEEDDILHMVRAGGGDLEIQPFIEFVLSARRETLSRPEICEAAGLLGHAKQLEDAQASREDDTRSRAWSKWWAVARNLKVTAGEEIEAARWVYGTRKLVRRWFTDMQSEMEGVDPSMIFNYDEVMVAIGKTGQVISSSEQRVFRKRQGKLPHFTIGPCINMSGEHPPVLIVLPQILQKTVNETLKWFIDDGKVHLVASAKGWVTERVFTEFAKQFCDWLQSFRREKPNREDSPAILFIDNAPTHNAREAMDIFKAHNVKVITFPPHMTHIMQPIDVSWARSFKAWFTREFRKMMRDADKTTFWRGPRAPNDAQWTRACVISAAITACDMATNYNQCIRAFDKTGLARTFTPVNVLANVYLRDADIDQEERERIAKPNRLFISSRVLTSEAWNEEVKAFHARTSPGGIVAQPVPEELQPEDIVVEEDADKEVGIDDVDLEAMRYDEAWAAEGHRPTIRLTNETIVDEEREMEFERRRLANIAELRAEAKVSDDEDWNELFRGVGWKVP
jgi:hypothetical protein